MIGVRNLEVRLVSWINDLYLTYENNEDRVAEDLSAKAILLPIAHSTQNAQIEIVISKEGEFVRAYSIAKGDAITIIPVTEDSAARGNGNNPHYLEDKLEYIAGDYEQYTGVNNTDKYNKFLSFLIKWSESSYTTMQVQAIRTYIAKASVIKDLVQAKVLEEEQGQLTDKKIEAIAQKEAFVRFSIQPYTIEDTNKEEAVYKDKELFKSYVKYYVSQQEDVDLCYASGEVIPCSTKHPSKIRHSGDKAKLISANDTSGYTYRGRFSESSQIASIGYETSQKAHNALRWLIAKQGFSIGELVIVAWEISGKEIISPTEDTDECLFGDEKDEIITTNEAYAKKLELAAKGYKQHLNNQAEIVVMGLEAATTGRLSISFYKKMMGSTFMENILEWHRTCFWRHHYKKKEDEKGYRWFVGAPSPRDIAIAAFGGRNDKLIKATIERILPCIIDKKDIPQDIVKAAVARASNPNGFENGYEHMKAVSVACALVRKHRYDRSNNRNQKKGEEWEMALDRTNTDRSYVYGRLLGAAQKLEEMALYYSGETNRTTAAERFCQQFVRKPRKTWKIINDQLRPYMAKLKAMDNREDKANSKASSKSWYIKELRNIYDLISEEDFMKEEPLSEVYLLGYNCQLNSYDKNDKDKQQDLEEDN